MITRRSLFARIVAMATFLRPKAFATGGVVKADESYAVDEHVCELSAPDPLATLSLDARSVVYHSYAPFERRHTVCFRGLAPFEAQAKPTFKLPYLSDRAYRTVSAVTEDTSYGPLTTLELEEVGDDDSPVPEMNRFARTWREFKAKIDGGVMDVKTARKLSAEWRAVEKSGTWPRDSFTCR